MPHITVTIPVYNRAHLVGFTIDSILSQTFQDFDVLIVDDASKDDSAAVARQYCARDARLRLEVNPQNLGLTRNWNRCLELAAGPLVQIMQSDDLIDADYLQRVSDAFQLHPSIGFVAASCRYIDGAGRVIHAGVAVQPRLYRPGDEAVAALVTGGYPHVSSIIMRRACYEEAGGFDEAIWHGPDMEMNVRMAARYGFYHVGAICTSFRRHGSNMGNLEYLREEFLDIDQFKKRKTLSYLSPEGLHTLGIADLDRHLARDAGTTALSGALVTMAYGRSSLSRHYLGKAVQCDRRMWLRRRWWMAAVLSLLPPLGRWVMERRMRLSSTDQTIADAVETSLTALGEGS